MKHEMTAVFAPVPGNPYPSLKEFLFAAAGATFYPYFASVRMDELTEFFRLREETTNVTFEELDATMEKNPDAAWGCLVSIDGTPAELTCAQYKTAEGWNVVVMADYKSLHGVHAEDLQPFMQKLGKAIGASSAAFVPELYYWKPLTEAQVAQWSTEADVTTFRM